MFDKLNGLRHKGVSIKEKAIELQRPCNFIKLTKSQQEDVKELRTKKHIRNKIYVNFITAMYDHYIDKKLEQISTINLRNKNKEKI